MRFVALALIAACGGAPVTPVAEPPRLRVLACARAPLTPEIPTEDYYDEDSGDVYGGLLGVGGGGIGYGTVASVLRSNIAIGSASSTARVGPMPMRRHLRERLDAIRACYAAAQKTDKTLRGRVVARFGLDRAGVPTGLVVDGPAALGACVTRGIAGLTVPPASDPAAVFEYPFEFGFTEDAPSSFMTGDPPAPWMPFSSIDDGLDDGRLSSVARAAETAVRQRILELEACFPPDAPTGSLRTILSFWEDGSTSSVRSGGLGAYAVERCVAEVLDDLRLAIRPNTVLDLACDLGRGDAQPWRLSPEGYRVIEVTAREAEPPADLDNELSYALVVAPDAPAAHVSRALEWVRDAIIVLIAMRDDRGALVYVGHGRIASSVTEEENSAMTPHPSLIVRPGTVTACLLAHDRTVKLADAAAVAGLVEELAQLCKRNHCATTLGIVHGPTVPMREVATVATAVRREGFTRVLLDAFSTCRDR